MRGTAKVRRLGGGIVDTLVGGCWRWRSHAGQKKMTKEEIFGCGEKGNAIGLVWQSKMHKVTPKGKTQEMKMTVKTEC